MHDGYAGMKYSITFAMKTVADALFIFSLVNGAKAQDGSTLEHDAIGCLFCLF